jgi:hypothetical protein
MSGKQQDESVNLTEHLVVVRAVTPEDMAAVAAGRPRRELSFSGEWEEDPQARFEHAAATGEPVSILIDLGQGQQSYTVFRENRADRDRLWFSTSVNSSPPFALPCHRFRMARMAPELTRRNAETHDGAA